MTDSMRIIRVLPFDDGFESDALVIATTGTGP